MSSLWIVIPTAGRLTYLPQIISASNLPSEQIVLVQTKAIPSFPGVSCISFEGEFNIQRWWNYGIDFAEKHGAKYVAVLNDDVRLPSGILQEMLSLMIRESTTLVRPQGDFGHCWILRLDRQIRPDPIFRWYMGDHDLEKRSQRNGGGFSVTSKYSELRSFFSY